MVLVAIRTVPSAGEVDDGAKCSGSYVHAGFPIGLPVDIANEVIAPAGFYFNVHRHRRWPRARGESVCRP